MSTRFTRVESWDEATDIKSEDSPGAHAVQEIAAGAIQASLTEAYSEPHFVEIEEEIDVVLGLFRSPLTRLQVIDYFSVLTGSEELSRLILKYSDAYEVPPSLAFSLSWVESGFSPDAVSVNNSSVDRGLFQLNSRSFPNLEDSDFFDPETNTKIGIQYLAYCLVEGRNEIVGLAMYNAGMTRVRRGGTPKMTLDYISKILDYKEELEQDFLEKMEKEKILICRS